MKKKIIKLDALEVKSFTTDMSNEIKIKGGERSAINPLGTFCSCDCDFT